MKATSERGGILALTGLREEARIVRGSGIHAIAGVRSLDAAERSLACGFDRVRAIISFGIAGGLDRSLPTGTIVIARHVIGAVQRWTTNEAWSAALAQREPASIRADIAAAAMPVLSVAAKERLSRETGAVAVDTESEAAARLAAELDVPFAVFRVIADPAGRALPDAAFVAVRRDGSIDVAAVLRSVRRSMGQIPQLLRTGLEARTALRALARGRARLGEGLAYPDFRELLLDVP